MESGERTIAAYVARKVSLGDRVLARKFQQVDVEVKTAEVESVGGETAAPDSHSQRLSSDLMLVMLSKGTHWQCPCI